MKSSEGALINFIFSLGGGHSIKTFEDHCPSILHKTLDILFPPAQLFLHWIYNKLHRTQREKSMLKQFKVSYGSKHFKPLCPLLRGQASRGRQGTGRNEALNPDLVSRCLWLSRPGAHCYWNLPSAVCLTARKQRGHRGLLGFVNEGQLPWKQTRIETTKRRGRFKKTFFWRKHQERVIYEESMLRDESRTIGL